MYASLSLRILEDTTTNCIPHPFFANGDSNLADWLNLEFGVMEFFLKILYGRNCCGYVAMELKYICIYIDGAAFYNENSLSCLKEK